MNHPYLDLIKKQIPIIFDGAVGTEIQKASIAQKDYGHAIGSNEILNVNRPDVLIDIHKKYLRAGANIIQTNTFGGSRPKLKEYHLENRVYEINNAAAINARNAIKESGINDRPLMVCGSMGPTGFLPSSNDKELSGISFDQLVEIYAEQSSALIDGGIDLIRIETSQDLLEVRAAIFGIKESFRKLHKIVPIQVQITIDTNGLMLLGSNVEAFLGAVAALGVSVVGINCGAGPSEMAPAIKKLLSLTNLPIAALPNAGMPQNIDGKAVYGLKPEQFADLLEPLVTKDGLNIIGGCCGTSPDHIQALSKKLIGCKVAERKNTKAHCWVSTGINGIDLENIKRPIIIGERLNTQGSRKTKEFVLANNYDELFQVANEQIKCGSSLLDICVAVTERDIENETMKSLVRFLSDRSRTPFCIDTVEPSVMEAALKVSPGSVMINSINLEHGAVKARNILKLASDYGCPIVALPIDDEGMARSVDRKMELIKRLYDIACREFGLPDHYLYIDPLVFTLATGDANSADAAVASLEAIRRIKREFPGIRTVMGVSNVSFGLNPKARRVLNNLMLKHAVEAGLDAAIFNPLHIDKIESYDPLAVSAGDDLIFNRKSDALSAYVKYFESVSESVVKENKKKIDNLSLEEKLKQAILSRDKRDLSSVVQKLTEKMAAQDILNSILLPAMAEVGDKMSSGEMILPFVLQSAEVMKEAITILEPYLKENQSAVKGKFVLATVYGDVHDIGKNLVGSILKNQGYDVIDLGKQVPVEKIIKAVQDEKPVAVGLSALLVTTSKQMRLCIEELEKKEIKLPVFIGGAAVNKNFASRIATLDSGEYEGGVYYAKDAFEVSRILDKEPLRNNNNTKNISGTVENKSAVQPEALEYGTHIEPPFWGTGEILTWKSDLLLSSIEKDKLFKAEWGGGKLNAEEFKKVKEKDFNEAFDRLQKNLIQKDLIDARGFYGFFPVITDNEQCILLSPDNFSKELITFKFPRMPKKQNRSLSDYFRSDSDVLGIQVVTIGKKLSEYCHALFHQEDKYSDGFFLNGIGNYIVENLADKITNEMRRALGLQMGTGRRYSFGYPGLPSLEEQKELFELIGAEERLGITLTPGFQMDPEHSTIGIFVHHPKAEYLF